MSMEFTQYYDYICVVVVVVVVVYSSSSSSSRTDRRVHFNQNAGLRLFVHPWSVRDIDDCY